MGGPARGLERVLGRFLIGIASCKLGRVQGNRGSVTWHLREGGVLRFREGCLLLMATSLVASACGGGSTTETTTTTALRDSVARIAFQSLRDGNYEVYVMDADGSNQTRLTNNPAFDGVPVWSPDG